MKKVLPFQWAGMLRHIIVLACLIMICSSSGVAQTQPLIVFPKSSGFQLKNEDMSAAALNKAQAGGVKYVRKGIYWGSIESSKGVYNWTQTDTWINDMQARGFSMVITVVWNNRLYEDIWDRAIVTEPGRQAYAGFCAKLATRYKGKDIIWEIWNEPNLRSFWHENAENRSNTDAMAEEYTELVKDTVPAMKAADPACRVVAGSISALWTDSFNWFDRCCELGILTSGVDGISMHPYGFRWPELAMLEGYTGLTNILTAHGDSTMPLLNSEVGYPEGWITERGISAAEVKNAQAWMYVRQNLVDAMANVQVTIWYELTDPSYGILNNDLTERPTFVAAQVMTSQLNGYSFVKRVSLSSALDYAAIFENSQGQQKMVVWTTPDKTKPLAQRIEVPHSVPIPVGKAGTYVVTNIFGTTTNLTTTTDQLNVTLTGGPQYIPIEKIVAGYSNVARGKTATVSTGSGATKLTDGILNTNSRWMADSGFPQWAMVDLGGQFLVDKVVLAQHAQRTSSYNVEVWNGTAWSIVASGTNNTSTNVTATFAPTVASKIRFNITAGSLYLKVFELEAYGQAYVPAPYVNVALGKTTTISTGSGATKLTDGILNTNSRWLADYGFPQWAEIDLAGSFSVDKVVFSQYAQRTTNYMVQTWTGSAWSTVYTGTGNTSLNITATFAPVSTTKVRFQVTAGSAYLKVYELEVFGRANP